jgi:hypothetical protein
MGAVAIKNMRDSLYISNTPITYNYGVTSQSVFANFTNASLQLTTNEKNHINDYVEYLNATGDYANIESIQSYLMGSQAKSLIDFKRTKSPVPIGTISWDQSNGFTTPGIVNNVLDVNYTPSVDASIYSLNSAFFGVFLTVATTASGVSATIAGCQNAAGTSQTLLFQSSTGILHRCNSGVAGTYAITGGADNNTFYLTRRTSSTSSTGTANGAGISATGASVSLPDKSFHLGQRNGNTPDFPFAGSYGMVVIGNISADVWRVYNKTQEFIINRKLYP